MSDTEKLKLAEDQARVVLHLALAIAETYKGKVQFYEILPPELALLNVDLDGTRSAEHMEILGNVLNSLEAVTEVDEWTSGVFAKAHDAEWEWPKSKPPKV